MFLFLSLRVPWFSRHFRLFVYFQLGRAVRNARKKASEIETRFTPRVLRVFVIAEHTNREEKSNSPALAAAGAKVPKGETPRHSFFPLCRLRHRMKRLNLSLMSAVQSGLICSERIQRSALFWVRAQTKNKDWVEIHAKYSGNNSGEK